MLINLAFIKAANGLFYFALDYVAALEVTTSAILVRTPTLAAAVRRRFPSAPVRVEGPWQAARAALAASRRGEMVFTPSSHPVPWCDRQLVVMHDSFPFEGAKGRFKAGLFFLAMRTSRAAAGYINVSDARTFLMRGGLSPERLVASPNRMAPPVAAPLRGSLAVSQRPVIGLFGTDSPKKNYDRLFAAVACRPSAVRTAFRLYGQPNDYAARIIAAFPLLDIAVSDSGAVELDAFVRSVDLVASAATREGFGRPMALALASGVPAWIVDAPVFREFYGGAATFHADPEALGTAIAALAPGMALPRPTFALPEAAERDFHQCVAWLTARDEFRP